MTDALKTMKRRWHGMGRRLFFLPCCATTACLSMTAPASSNAQDMPSVKILQRQARLMRNETGMYRVIEAMLIELDREIPPEFVLPEPLGLVEVNAVVGSVMGIGGDVPVTQIVYDEPRIAIVGPVGARVLEIAVTYALPQDARGFEFNALWPVDAFLVEVDRGSIDARPSGGLSAPEAGGTDERPVLRYEASALSAGQAVGFTFFSSRVRWAERIAVLLACSVAAGAACLVVWRRESGSAAA
jgi:hypothetical protein